MGTRNAGSNGHREDRWLRAPAIVAVTGTGNTGSDGHLNPRKRSAAMGTSNGASHRNPLRHTHVSAAPRPRSLASPYPRMAYWFGSVA